MDKIDQLVQNLHCLAAIRHLSERLLNVLMESLQTSHTAAAEVLKSSTLEAADQELHNTAWLLLTSVFLPNEADNLLL